MNPRPESPSRPVVRFLGIFALVYGMAILPWPGWNEIYGRYFQALGRLVFAQEGERRILHFTPVFEGTPAPLDTQITVANRDLLDRDGKGRAVVMTVSSRNVGWVPTAIVVALILATPVPWRRRGWALLWGLVSIHGFILLGIAVHIWNISDDSTGLRLITFSPFWKHVVQGLEKTTAQLGANFVAPVLVWILVVFRRQDFSGLMEPVALRSEPGRGAGNKNMKQGTRPVGRVATGTAREN